MVTAAVHSTRAPPPFAELLHWSMFMGKDSVIVDAPPTVHTNPALVPPFPEPLHWPTVACPTEVMPGVFAGTQTAETPSPEPTHW